MKVCPIFSNKRHNLAIIALIVTNIIWGAASPIFKLSLQNIPPFTLAFLRFFGAMLVVLPFTIDNLYIARKDYLKLFLLSFFGITVNITFFFLGLERAPSINTPIIASSGPIFLYLFAIFFLHEKPKGRIFGGLLISFIGVLIIVGQPLWKNEIDKSILGNLFFVLATLGAVGHAIFSKEILSRYQAITVTFWSFWIGQITFIPFFAQDLVTISPFANLDHRGIIGLVFGVFFSSAAAYFLFEWSVKRIKAQEIGLFTYIDPIVAIALAYPLLGEKITFVYLLGSVLVFAGIFVAEGRLHYHPIHKIKR